MKRLCILVLVMAVSASAAIGLAGCGAPEEKPKPKPKPIPSKTVGPSEPITVSAFRYRLLSSEEATRIGPPKAITSAVAKGRFIILRFQAELAGSRVRTLDRREIEIVDSKNKVYRSSQDAQAALTIQKKPNLFKQDTTYQGIPVQGWVAFDVDKKAKGLKVRIVNLLEPESFIGYIRLPY